METFYYSQCAPTSEVSLIDDLVPFDDPGPTNDCSPDNITLFNAYNADNMIPTDESIPDFPPAESLSEPNHCDTINGFISSNGLTPRNNAVLSDSSCSFSQMASNAPMIPFNPSFYQTTLFDPTISNHPTASVDLSDYPTTSNDSTTPFISNHMTTPLNPTTSNHSLTTFDPSLYETDSNHPTTPLQPTEAVTSPDVTTTSFDSSADSMDIDVSTTSLESCAIGEYEPGGKSLMDHLTTSVDPSFYPTTSNHAPTPFVASFQSTANLSMTPFNPSFYHTFSNHPTTPLQFMEATPSPVITTTSLDSSGACSVESYASSTSLGPCATGRNVPGGKSFTDMERIEDMMESPNQESFFGIVETSEEAELLLEAARLEKIPFLTRRLSLEERHQIRPGSAFVFVYRKSKTKRDSRIPRHKSWEDKVAVPGGGGWKFDCKTDRLIKYVFTRQTSDSVCHQVIAYSPMEQDPQLYPPSRFFELSVQQGIFLLPPGVPKKVKPSLSVGIINPYIPRMNKHTDIKPIWISEQYQAQLASSFSDCTTSPIARQPSSTPMVPRMKSKVLLDRSMAFRKAMSCVEAAKRGELRIVLASSIIGEVQKEIQSQITAGSILIILADRGRFCWLDGKEWDEISRSKYGDFYLERMSGDLKKEHHASDGYHVYTYTKKTERDYMRHSKWERSHGKIRLL